jgi:hypothetical protein
VVQAIEHRERQKLFDAGVAEEKLFREIRERIPLCDDLSGEIVRRRDEHGRVQAAVRRERAERSE